MRNLCEHSPFLPWMPFEEMSGEKSGDQQTAKPYLRAQPQGIPSYRVDVGTIRQSPSFASNEPIKRVIDGEKQNILKFPTHNEASARKTVDLSFRGQHIPVSLPTGVTSDVPCEHSWSSLSLDEMSLTDLLPVLPSRIRPAVQGHCLIQMMSLRQK